MVSPEGDVSDGESEHWVLADGTERTRTLKHLDRRSQLARCVYGDEDFRPNTYDHAEAVIEFGQMAVAAARMRKLFGSSRALKP